jgi:Uma2 family endonuclease
MKTIQVRRWTREQYDRMVQSGVFSSEENVELIDGEIIEVAPQGSKHATAIRLCESLFRDAFRSGYDVRSQLPLAVDPMSEPEPDIAVVEGSARDYAEAHPTSAALVVEIADATLAFDREHKGSLYARAGIPEYWILNLTDRQLEVYRNPKTSDRAPLGWEYASVERYSSGQSVAPLFQPQAQIAVADLLP